MYNAVYLDEVLTDVQEAKIWYKITLKLSKNKFSSFVAYLRV